MPGRKKGRQRGSAGSKAQRWVWMLERRILYSPRYPPSVGCFRSNFASVELSALSCQPGVESLTFPSCKAAEYYLLYLNARDALLHYCSWFLNHYSTEHLPNFMIPLSTGLFPPSYSASMCMWWPLSARCNWSENMCHVKLTSVGKKFDKIRTRACLKCTYVPGM